MDAVVSDDEREWHERQSEGYLSLFRGYGLCDTSAAQSSEKASSPTAAAEREAGNERLLELMKETSAVVLSRMEGTTIGHMVHCHEWNPLPEMLPPIMQLHKHLKMKKTLSFSVADQGSAAPLACMEWLGAKEQDKERWSSLLVCSDRIQYPQRRTLHDTYRREDASASFVIGNEHREFQIVDLNIHTWSAGGAHFYEIDAAAYEALEMQMVMRIFSYFTSNEFGANGPVKVIIQHVSERFLKTVGEQLQEVVDLYIRDWEPNVNFGCSDPLYGLVELRDKQLLQAEDEVVLVFAGPLGVLGFLRLKYDLHLKAGV